MPSWRSLLNKRILKNKIIFYTFLNMERVEEPQIKLDPPVFLCFCISLVASGISIHITLNLTGFIDSRIG